MTAKKTTSKAAAKQHHLDKRADALIEQGAGDGDDLLHTRAVSDWLGVSIQFLEIGRTRGHGPAFVQISPRVIRYRRADVRAWLQERSHKSTAEYGSAKIGA